MQDLNDLYFFAKVVESGGFAPAGRTLRQAKSKLSRRVAQLEERLGVRLIERSTRRFRVTEIGAAFYDRCKTILRDVEQAEALAAEAQSEPHGLVRFSSPTGLVAPMMRILPALLHKHPRMRLQLVATDRRVNLIDERIDVALRVRTSLDTDAELSIRALTKNRRHLVASKELAAALGDAADPEALRELPTLSTMDDARDASWTLLGPREQERVVRHEPRLSCSDFGAVRDAAIAGLGVAFLPDEVCSADLAAGRLVRVLPAWQGAEGIVHLVFTTRRGLPPAVRALIDHVAAHIHEAAL